MVTHSRLGAESVFASLLPELVARVIEAASTWPSCRTAMGEGLVRMLGGDARAGGVAGGDGEDAEIECFAH
jgi:hypothetical protein